MAVLVAVIAAELSLVKAALFTEKLKPGSSGLDATLRELRGLLVLGTSDATDIPGVTGTGAIKGIVCLLAVMNSPFTLLRGCGS